jgi:hypothetical protein
MARRRELYLTCEKASHATELDDSGGIDVGILGMSAALAGKVGLREPIARVDEAAEAAFLRTVVRGHDDGELAYAPRLRTGVVVNRPQALCRMDRLSPAFARTFRPGASTVPLAERVMFLVCKSSKTNSLACGSSTKARLALWAMSERTRAS